MLKSSGVLPVSRTASSNTDPQAEAERRRLECLAIATAYNSMAAVQNNKTPPSLPSAIVHLTSRQDNGQVLYDKFGRLMPI